MRDEVIERLGLVSIIIGLLVLFYLVLDFSYEDVFYLEDDDDRVFYEGVLLENRFSGDTGWSYLEVEACRVLPGFMEGSVGKELGDRVFLRGSFSGGSMLVEEIR